MNTKTHWIAQALATLLQVLNVATNIVPAKYQAIVTAAITVVQAGMGLYNHYYNPDGTPASVAYVVKLLLLFVLLSGAAMAQTAPAPQPIFSISTQAVAVHIGGQTVPGTDAVGSFNLTPNVQLQSDNILAPSNNFQAYLGGVKYYAPFLSKPFEKTSLSDVAPYVHASIGIVRNVPATGTAQQHYGALVDAGFDYRVNGTFSVGPRAGWLNAPGFGPHPNGYFVSANLSFVLGKK